MVGHAGSTTGNGRGDMTLTRSKVKVTVTSKYPKIVIVIASMPREVMRAGSDDCQPACGAFYGCTAYRCRHYIFALWFLLSSIFLVYLFFLA